MMRRLFPVLAVGLCLALVGGAFYFRHVTTANLPPRFVRAVELHARADAVSAAARVSGATVWGVLGTGSMAPFIPSAPVGMDPKQTRVAYAVVEPAAFASIQAGNLLAYMPEWANGQVVLHVAAQRDSGGWIMIGIANRHFENGVRMTPDELRGVVTAVYTWPQ